MQKQINGLQKKVIFLLPTILLAIVFISSCNIQKRRYSIGYHVNRNGKSNVHNKLEPVENKVSKLPLQKADESSLNIDPIFEENDIREKIISSSSNQFFHIKKAVPFSTDTIKNKKGNDTTNIVQNIQKPRIELFSKLSLIVLLISVFISISMPILLFGFELFEPLLALIIINFYVCGFAALLAAEGKFRIKKNPNKYKRPFLADSIFVISLSMLLLSILAGIGFLLAFAASAGLVW